jgi:hypothetical protein
MTEEKKCCGNCKGDGGCGKPEPPPDLTGDLLAIIGWEDTAESRQFFDDRLKRMTESLLAENRHVRDISELVATTGKTPLSENVIATMLDRERELEQKVHYAGPSPSRLRAMRNSLSGADGHPVGGAQDGLTWLEAIAALMEAENKLTLFHAASAYQAEGRQYEFLPDIWKWDRLFSQPERKFRSVIHVGDWPGPPQFDGPNDPVTLVTCIPFIMPEELGPTPKKESE